MKQFLVIACIFVTLVISILGVAGIITGQITKLSDFAIVALAWVFTIYGFIYVDEHDKEFINWI